MKNEVTSVMMCGVGGQGILLAAEVAARAAILAGFQVKTNEVHGMAQRGGSVVASVRYGNKVHNPLVETGTADALLSLEAIEAIRHHAMLRADGLAVVSRQHVVPITVSSGKATYPEPEEPLRRLFPRLKYLDALAVAGELGVPRAANIVLLGALSEALDGLDSGTWMEALRQCVKPKFLEVNLEAFRRGAAC